MKAGSKTSAAGGSSASGQPTHVHLTGICGTGMGSLAGMFHERGFHVTGSDAGVYPPMSDFLHDMGIKVMDGYRPENVASRPDLVVVGNVIRRTNPEAQEVQRLGIPITTMPGALNRFFIGSRTRIVVAGTHGKTTVSAMIAWILYKCGLDPGFMIGGLPTNFGKNYCLGQGNYFIIEGDEYDTAYFDKRPKFLHYHPDIGVITSCEFDHGDIYDSLDQIKEQFRAFTALVPSNGCLVANWDDRTVRDVVEGAGSLPETYGTNDSAKWSATNARDEGDGIHVEIRRDGRITASGTLPVFGSHNLLNALAAIAVAAKVGVNSEKAMDALESFQGVKRRQEILGEIGGITIIDDFAHHPTAVEVTCEGVRSRYPDRRLVAVFEPRTNTSRRAVFQSEYARVFSSADLVVLREPRDLDGFPEWDRFSSAKLAADLRSQGKDARAFEDTDGIMEFLSEVLRYGDVVLIMSNGSCDNLNVRLLDALGERQE